LKIELQKYAYAIVSENNKAIVVGINRKRLVLIDNLKECDKIAIFKHSSDAANVIMNHCINDWNRMSPMVIVPIKVTYEF
jgi:hypothetical protein